MSFITILFDVHCNNFVSRIPSWYYCLIWQKQKCHTFKWLSVAVTLDSFILVTFPLKANQLCSPSKAKIVVATIVLTFPVFDGVNYLWLLKSEVLTNNCHTFVSGTDKATKYNNQYVWMSTYRLPTCCEHIWKLKKGLDLHISYKIDGHCLSPLSICVSQLCMCIA